jgi:2-amino-4-hydroxy-6-hydroxymethyldihydropteridine diphosphokinase
MSRVWIALGGNCGDRAALLGRAVDRLESSGVTARRISNAYETAPERPTDGPPFLNAVLEAESALSPCELLGRMRQVEVELGRPPGHAPGPRTCDLDLLAYDGLVRAEPPDLVLPHPRMHQRPFVLVPLCELDVHWRHPLLERTASELLAALSWVAGQVRLQGPLPRGCAVAPTRTRT